MTGARKETEPDRGHVDATSVQHGGGILLKHLTWNRNHNPKARGSNPSPATTPKVIVLKKIGIFRHRTIGKMSEGKP
jgi:hypothetical protein